MKYVLYTILFFLFFTQNTFCQNNCKSANITTLDGKIIEGCIEYKNWSETPKFIRFKANSATEIIEYTAADIKAFTVNERTYKSGKVEIETSPRDLPNITESKKIQTKTATVFLRNLIAGKKSLYLFVDEKGNDHFYIYEDDVFELLRYKKYFEIGNNKKIIVKENTEYIEQLAANFVTCSFIKEKLAALKYKKSTLISIFREYQDCYTLKLRKEQRITNEQREFGVLLGLTTTTVRFHATISKLSGTTIINFLDSTKFSFSQNVTGGFYFTLKPKKGSKKWAWTNEITYHRYRVKGDYFIIIYRDRDVYNDFDLGISYLRLNSTAQYKFRDKKNPIYVKFGISLGRVLSMDYNTRRERTRYLTIITERDLPIFTFPNLNEGGIILGLGTRYRNLFWELRGEIGNGMSDFVILDARVYRGTVIVGWAF